MSRSKDTRNLVLLFVAVAAASTTLGVVGTLLIKSPAQVAADAAPPRSTLLTSAVAEGTISDTLYLAGTIALGNSIELTPKAPMDGSDAVVTKVPIPVGGEFQAGSMILEISDRPLIVLSSPIPLIRDLSTGMAGPDVERLQQALRGAGLHVHDKAGYFGASTTTAVKKLYQDVGYAAPTVGRQVLVSRSEIALVPMSGLGHVTALGAVLGGTSTKAFVTVTSLPPVINANVGLADAASLKVGTVVSVRIAGVFSEGSVSLIGVPVQNGSSGFETPVSITSNKVLPPASIGETAEISVNLNKDDIPGLKVPLSALYTNSSGGTSVAVVENGKLRALSVIITETGDGFAKIVDNSKTISPGDKVRVGTTG